MTTVGFDTAKLGTLATSVTNCVPGLGTLDSDITKLRHDASSLMEGAPVPSDAGLPTPKNTDIAMGLLDLSTEIKRRLQLIEGIQAMERMGLKSTTDPMALDLVDEAEVRGVINDIVGLPDADVGINGNRDDLQALQEKLDRLNPEELDQVLDGLTDEQLAKLGELARNTGDGFWNPVDHNGLERMDRFEFFGTILSRVSPSRIDKVLRAFPELNPGFETTDSALGENAQTQESGQGMRYGVPPGTVWRTDANGNPVVDASEGQQGSFGDCWFIASMLSQQAVDENFIPNHMTVNPNGTISVKMYDKDGDPHWTTVTNELPMTPDGRVAGARGTHLWPSYYEKAFAQLYEDDDGGAPDGMEDDPRYDRREVGTYGATEWDFSRNAAPYISGKPADEIGHDFEATQEAYNEGKSVLISTRSSAPDPPDEWGTAYSTRHVYFVKEVTENTIVVGNPWGSNYPDITMTQEQFDTYFQDSSAMEKTS